VQEEFSHASTIHLPHVTPLDNCTSSSPSNHPGDRKISHCGCTGAWNGWGSDNGHLRLS